MYCDVAPGFSGPPERIERVTCRRRTPIAGAGIAAAMLFSLTTVAVARAETERPRPAESFAGNYLAALIASAKKDTAAAAIFYREAHRADPRNAELLERALVAELADGNMTEAFRLADRTVQRDAANPLARAALGVRAIRNRQFATARDHFARGGGAGRRADLTATLLNAWSYVGSGDLKRALELVDRFNEPQLSVYRNFFGGLMADVAGNKAEAGRRLKAAYAAEGVTIRVADAYARWEARHGSRDEALRIYERLSDRLPNQPFVAEAARTLRTTGALDPLINTVPEGAGEVLYNLGSTGGNSGDEMAAAVYLQLAVHLHPRNELAIVQLAETMEQVNQYDRAIELYARIPDGSGLKLRTIIRSAYVLDQMGRTDAAIQKLTDQLKATPDDLELLNGLATIYRSKKRWPEAIATLTRAIELVREPNRNHWNLFYSRGTSHERNKEWPKAEVDLKRALDLLPPDRENSRSRAQVLNYLAYSWVDQNMNVDQSFEMLRQAVSLTEARDGYIVDSLGWAYYRQGRFEDAVRELERAVELKPSDPVINDHLGDAYWRVGRIDEARFKWGHARDMKPEPEDLERILKKLERGLDVPAAAEAQPSRPNGG